MNGAEYTVLPRLFEKEISIKKITVESLKLFIEFYNQANHQNIKPLILTLAGQIEAEQIETNLFRPENPNGSFFKTETDGSISLDLDAVNKLKIEIAKKIEEDDPEVTTNDCGCCIILHGATLKPWGNPEKEFRYPQMLVFVDQILGLSFINL